MSSSVRFAQDSPHHGEILIGIVLCHQVIVLLQALLGEREDQTVRCHDVGDMLHHTMHVGSDVLSSHPHTQCYRMLPMVQVVSVNHFICCLHTHRPVYLCYPLLSNLTKCYLMLPSVIGCYRVLSDVTECYRCFTHTGLYVCYPVLPILPSILMLQSYRLRRYPRW